MCPQDKTFKEVFGREQRHIGFCFSCGRLRKMNKKKDAWVCSRCKTETTIHNDRVEIVIKKCSKRA